MCEINSLYGVGMFTLKNLTMKGNEIIYAKIVINDQITRQDKTFMLLKNVISYFRNISFDSGNIKGSDDDV
jgi:hypothetical protein